MILNESQALQLGDSDLMWFLHFDFKDDGSCKAGNRLPLGTRNIRSDDVFALFRKDMH